MTSSLVYNFMSNQQANSLDIDMMNVSIPIFCLPPTHIFFVPGFSTLVKIVSPIPACWQLGLIHQRKQHRALAKM